MSKVDILRLDSTTANDTAATLTINQNFKKLQDAVENTLSRDGTTPNFMDANLDMNSKRVINVGNPVNDHDAISKKYFEDTIGDAASYATQAQASANAAASSAQASSVSAANALTSSIVAESSADLAKDWATKLGDTVDGVEYSSKYYAQASEGAEENASIWAEGTDLEVQAIGGTHSAKGWANVLGTVYKPKGSIAFASLPTLSADIEGFVYNVTDDFTTTADFVEGAGKSYPAGTNVVCVDTGSSVYKWDVLGSFIDLSGKQDVLVSGTNIKTINNSSILGSGDLQIDSLPSQTGHAGEFLTTDGTDASWASASTYHPTLFTFQWSDCLKNDVQWLRADTFSWQSGAVYEAAYEHLVDDIGYVRYMIPDDGFNNKFYREPSEDTEMYAWTNQFSTLYTVSEFPQNGDDFYYHNQVYGTVLSTGVEPGSGAVTPTTETIGSYTITYYEADDGHKIVLANQETTVQSIYAESGVAWYYILDTANTRFKLPRTKYGFVGLRDTVEDYVEAGLPNITGSFTAPYIISKLDGTQCSGAISAPNDGALGGYYGTTSAATNDWGNGFSINASDSSSVYGNSTTVQPPATEMYLYFYVGSFTQTALENTAGLNAELFNGKADIDAGNISSAGKQRITGWVIPDYTNGQNISTGAFTPTKNGMLIVKAQNGINQQFHLYLGSDNTGEEIAYGSVYAQQGGNTWILPLAQGETYYITYSSMSCKFYPCKGA